MEGLSSSKYAKGLRGSKEFYEDFASAMPESFFLFAGLPKDFTLDTTLKLIEEDLKIYLKKDDCYLLDPSGKKVKLSFYSKQDENTSAEWIEQRGGYVTKTPPYIFYNSLILKEFRNSPTRSDTERFRKQIGADSVRLIKGRFTFQFSDPLKYLKYLKQGKFVDTYYGEIKLENPPSLGYPSWVEIWKFNGIPKTCSLIKLLETTFSDRKRFGFILGVISLPSSKDQRLLFYVDKELFNMDVKGHKQLLVSLAYSKHQIETKQAKEPKFSARRTKKNGESEPDFTEDEPPQETHKRKFDSPERSKELNTSATKKRESPVLDLSKSTDSPPHIVSTPLPTKTDSEPVYLFGVLIE
jgi:hypothetical protein